MKKHLAPALFSLSLCAVMGGVRTVGAQTVSEAVAVVADSSSIVPLDPSQPALAGTLPAPSAVGAPVIAQPTSIQLGADARSDALPLAPSVAMVDWKMPTSRALIIGGATAAVIGLAAVGGEPGAIIAISGTAVAVYGLYLHYNR